MARAFPGKSSVKAYTLLWYVALCAALLTGNRSVAGEKHQFDKKEIAKIIMSQRDSIINYQFRFSCTRKILAEDKDPLGPPSPNCEFLIQEDARDGRKRRAWVKRGPSEQNLVEDTTATWDGKAFKIFRKVEKLGQVHAEPQDTIFFIPDSPLYNAMLVDSTKDGGEPDYPYDIVAFLESKYCVVAPETELLQGIECIVATLGTAERPMYRAWLDPSRGFAVVQKDTYNPGDRTKLWWRVRNLEFKDCGNGIWLPTQTVSMKYLAKGHSKEEWGIPSMELTYTADVVEVNADLPDELFDIRFPLGTFVHDKVAGVSYEIEDTLDAVLDDFLELQKESNIAEPLPRAAEPRKPGMASPSGETSPATPTAPAVATSPAPILWPYIVLVLAALLVIAGLIALLLKRRRAAGR